MQKVISLGMNCEVSFQIQKYVKTFHSSLFSWAFVMDDDLFLKALHSIDDIFENEIRFHMPTNDMFLDEKYQITFHGRTPKGELFDGSDNLKNQQLYEETITELKSRLAHLKEKFKKDIVSEDEKVYIKKILIEPDFETWGGQRKLERIITGLTQYFARNINDCGTRLKLVIVLEKKWASDEWKKFEKNGIYIRYVEFFAPVDNTKDGADNEGWNNIFTEFLK